MRVIPSEKSRSVSSKVKWNERVERGADRRGTKQATSAGDLQKSLSWQPQKLKLPKNQSQAR